jgi:hypothetical protein
VIRLNSEKDGEQSIRAFGETPRSNRVDTTKALHGNPEVAAEYLRSYSWVARDALAMIKAATRENQVKLTVSVPPSLHVLLRSWALCEGRELTSVVLQCVELSIRQLKSNGSIPSAAIRNYETACDERLAIGGL